MTRRTGKHPVVLKTSMYVNVPFYLREEQNITENSNVEYERVGNNQLIIRIGGKQ